MAFIAFLCLLLSLLQVYIITLSCFYCMSERDWENEGCIGRHMGSVELMARDTTTLPHEA